MRKYEAIPFFTRTAAKQAVFVLLCTLIAFSLRVYTFDRKSLWLDEIHTLNDSRPNLHAQLKFYKENPLNLHPPLFFVLTHLFQPFPKPERDLRIIPLIFGTLSIPMIYLLAKQFSPGIAGLCTLLLTFMTYHVSLSQDGRSYSLVMFLGMAASYFLMKHLQTHRRLYLLPVAILYAILFHTSYSSIPLIVFSQLLWVYGTDDSRKDRPLGSFFFLCGLTFLLCLPWILFVLVNYRGQVIMPPLQGKVHLSLFGILYGLFHDWTPYPPLMLVSVILLLLFPFVTRERKNAVVLLSLVFLPIIGLFLFCKWFNVAHFVTSRYLVSFLPFLLISLCLSLESLKVKFKRFAQRVRVMLLFLILFLASNLVILPFYYRGEKEDFRGLANYLKTHLRDGDKIFDFSLNSMPGILHYFGAPPDDRYYVIPFRKLSDGEIEYRKPFIYRGKTFVIYHSKNCCAQYVADGGRVWIIAGKTGASAIKKNSGLPLKGYFDGSFLNFSKFPEDASIYLFLWDPKSPDEKGIGMPIE